MKVSFVDYKKRIIALQFDFCSFSSSTRNDTAGEKQNANGDSGDKGSFEHGYA
jgi:hypothetical protein